MSIENIRVVTQSSNASVAIVPAFGIADSLPTGNATAVLHEVAGMLNALAERGQAGVIDLGGMPLSQADKAWLIEKLGHGEVEITLALDGASQIRETSFHGVWWLVHRNDKSIVTGEFIEVCRVPDLVLAHADDIQRSAESLRWLMSEV
jgi:HupH hydrogenase expression protein, C-terminal conserved region